MKVEETNNTQFTDYSDRISDIKDIVAGVSDIIDKHPAMKEMNFGLFYQHGRLGFVDLDAFAESTKAKIDVDGEEKTLTEIKNDIDKDKE